MRFKICSRAKQDNEKRQVPCSESLTFGSSTNFFTKPIIMKKLILSTLLFCLAFTLMQAQVILRPQVGINSSSLTGEGEGIDFNDEIGYQVGVDFQFGNQLYIQPGLHFEALNNQAVLTSTPNSQESDLTINRIRIPLMVGYRINPQEDTPTINLRVFTGPNASFTIRKKLDGFTINGDDFQDIIWGWNAGLGFDFSILFVDLGYTFGLSEIYESQQEAPRNNLFYGNVGLRIPL